VNFKLKTSYQPTGDQPQAIDQLTKGVERGEQHQTLLGVTGSGKTFTMANVIANTQRPTLVIAHNKTLAAQLYQEFRDYFPENAVSYFVSYYDYYQPEAYLPTTDTYIEKEADINDEIDKLRLAATTNLLTRQDVIVVASVSCIYNLGSPIEYGQYMLQLTEGEIIKQKTVLLQLANLQYERSSTDFRRGTYQLRGDTLRVWPAYQDTAFKIETLENRITEIREIDPLSGTPIMNADQNQVKRFVIYPAKHYMLNEQAQKKGLQEIEQELAQRLKVMERAGKTLEGYRLKQKVNYDLEMIREFGFVNGIENYSRYFDGRQPGQPPYTLLDYFAENQRRFGLDSFLTIIDESHMTIPQIRGMFHGDRSRKETLIEYGFRLPSALDNRPLQFHEFLERTPQNLYVSATPNDWEQQQSHGKVAEQLIRPTGLVDPLIELRPIENQVEDLVIEIIRRKALRQRVLVTTLTKKMAEALTEYLNTPEKIEILIKRFREKNATPDPDHGYQRSEYINVQKMKIGLIDQSYYKRIMPIEKLEEIPKPKVAYLHSDITTLDRSDILDDLRKGEYDVIIGINLLREGLDLPEVSLVAILDADKEGFLRSATALIQTMGRAARHEDGRTLLFADKMTKSMEQAIEETQRRRATQVAYNQKHNITPISINKPIREKLLNREETYAEKLSRKNKPEKLTGTIVRLNKKEIIDLTAIKPEALTPVEKTGLARKLTRRMNQAAKDLDFELATILRDTIGQLQ